MPLDGNRAKIDEPSLVFLPQLAPRGFWVGESSLRVLLWLPVDELASMFLRLWPLLSDFLFQHVLRPPRIYETKLTNFCNDDDAPDQLQISWLVACDSISRPATSVWPGATFPQSRTARGGVEA